MGVMLLGLTLLGVLLYLETNSFDAAKNRQICFVLSKGEKIGLMQLIRSLLIGAWLWLLGNRVISANRGMAAGNKRKTNSF